MLQIASVAKLTAKKNKGTDRQANGVTSSLLKLLVTAKNYTRQYGWRCPKTSVTANLRPPGTPSRKSTRPPGQFTRGLKSPNHSHRTLLNLIVALASWMKILLAALTPTNHWACAAKSGMITSLFQKSKFQKSKIMMTNDDLKNEDNHKIKTTSKMKTT